MSSRSSPFPPHGPGGLIANRFTVRRQAGRGGMGTVYLADDAVGRRPVALKLLHTPASPEVARRFTREAQLLSELHHPGIVSYVAHGLTEEGLPFLAMEWLEGEDLSQRLARQPLSLSDTLRLVRRVAEALAAAHARGIIHRDLKPSNLFLRGGHPEDAVLLDFGLARLASASQAYTGSSTVLGTPGYMAPEQASSTPDITSSADIFSLGCVLYECLTGVPPFRAPHPAAVLAKILFSEPAPLRTLRPELPASLQPLVNRMLTKAPAQRLADAPRLLRALEELEATPEVPPPTAALAPSPSGLAKDEQHLVSVLLATPATVSAEAPTYGPEEMAQVRQQLAPLLRELQSRGARATLLADGSLLATFALERGTATDQAALAAHCALSVKEHAPESFVVLTTGLSLRDRPLPVGEVVDRAGEFLRQLEGRRTAPLPHVMLDETTAGLLGPRFQLDKEVSGIFLLRGEHLSVDESRPLLGRPTPCVGREQELALLELAFSSCMEHSASRALLVTAPAGVGKSRLRHEFLRRLEQQGQPMLVLLGRGDPMNAGSAYGLLGEALRRLCGVVEGEPLEARRQKLSQRLARYLTPEQQKTTVAFLGELCEVPFPGEDTPELLAAREDPRRMSLQVSRAMGTFLRAELSQGPVLLVLEDLHWGDSPTVKLVDEVLGDLAECPLLVLALARPEVKELFPGLWARYLQELPLRGLSQKASTRLVHEVLGPHVPQALVSRLVEQASGNALFLEELIRGAAEGHGEETPGTVMAMLQSRLQRLEPELRQVLLAASFFGRVFWAGGVRALLEGNFSQEELEHILRRGVELEVVQPQPGSRFPTEPEYRFRHSLLRDAAYSLIPDSLKPVGHRLAGAWLERVGEPDPLVVAEHYQLGQEKARAVRFFTRAGERFFERQDLLGAQRCLEAALACEPSEEAQVGLEVLRTSIAFWMDDFARSFTVGAELLPLPEVASMPWNRMMAGLILVCARSERQGTVAELGPRILGPPPAAAPVTPYIEAASALSCMTTWYGQRHEVLALLERMEAVSPTLLEPAGPARGWPSCAWGYFEHFLEARPWRSWHRAQEALQAFQAVGLESGQATARTLEGLTRAALGDLPGAREVLNEGLREARRRTRTQAVTFLEVHLAWLLAESAEPTHQEEARNMAVAILEAEPLCLAYMGLAHLALAKASSSQGGWAQAESDARRACELLGVFTSYQLQARTCLSAVLLAQGRAAEARSEAEAGARMLEWMEGAGAGSVGLWLALAETRLALGDIPAGEEALRRASHCLRARAEDIPDAAARERFLQRVPENARLREQLRRRWGESAASLLP